MAVTTFYSVPDDGRKGRPKHVELLTPNNEHKKVASRWHLYDQYQLYCVFNLSARWGWTVNAMSRPLYLLEIHPVPNVQEAG